MKIRKAGIILKQGSAKPRKIARELITWLAEKGVDTVVDTVNKDLDILITLGGDGTLLLVADKASRYEIPVMGINLGGLGFLTAVAAKERFEAMELLLAGKMLVQKRILLKTRLLGTSADRTSSENYLYALNDVVINKGDIDQIVKMRTWADQEFITTYRADGLIFSTPTGSTAYNLSSGGPIVQPGLPCILVTPICPFMLESRPVLLSPDVTLITQLDGKADNVKVIVDGRFAWNMLENSQLEVKTAKKPLYLVSMPQKGYFEILRNKLNWGGTGNKIPELRK
ncbi:MAG: NAD(+)/NADH kinase [Thermodesulfobacteriota bacterium]